MPSERVQRRIDNLLDQAEEALASREWTAVNELAEAVLAADPENDDAATFITMADRASAVSGESFTSGNSGEIDPPQMPSPNAELPTSFANGRYEVKSLLGEGGKKKVYLAHDTTLDRDVAFGLIKAEGLDADSRQRIPARPRPWLGLGTTRISCRFTISVMKTDCRTWFSH